MTPSHRTSILFAARVGALVSALLASALFGCSGPSGDDKSYIAVPPGPPIFNAVSDALELHCGTINCHGNDERNMRFFGLYGVRLNPKDKTGFGSTSDLEYEANFESIISIQPEKLTQVVRAHGAGADKWIVFSKGRAIEHHKGGARLVAGDAADTCIMSWLVAQPNGPSVNTDACTAATNVVPPGDDWTQ